MPREKFDGYEHLDFAPEKSFKTESLKKIVNEVGEPDFAYKIVLVDPAKLLLNDDATISNGAKHKMTKGALSSFCRMLRIPDPFARRIPFDLLQENARRLCSGVKGSAALVTRQGDDSVVNIRKDYSPLSNLDFLHRLEGILQEKSDWKPQSFVLSDTGLQVDLLDDAFPTLEPEVGDVTKAGLRFTTSETGFTVPTANMFLFRLVCSNGAVLPRQFGIVKETMSRLAAEKRLNRFFVGVERLKANFEQLKDRYMAMTETRMTDEHAVRVWKWIGKVVGTEAADVIFPFDPEERKELQLTVKARERKRRKDPFSGSNPVGSIEATYYDVYNNVTEKCKEFDHSEERRLQQVGGKILTLMRVAA